MCTASAAFRLALSLAVLGGCAAPQAVELPDDPWWFTVSPGGAGAAYAERKESDAYLVFDGRRLGPFP